MVFVIVNFCLFGAKQLKQMPRRKNFVVNINFNKKNMLLFSFVKRRFWWPRRRRFYANRFLFLQKKKRKLRPFYSFRSSRSFVHVNKSRYFALLKKWLLSRMYKYIQRRLTHFSFMRTKLAFPKLFFLKRVNTLK